MKRFLLYFIFVNIAIFSVGCIPSEKSVQASNFTSNEKLTAAKNEKLSTDRNSVSASYDEFRDLERFLSSPRKAFASHKYGKALELYSQARINLNPQTKKSIPFAFTSHQMACLWRMKDYLGIQTLFKEQYGANQGGSQPSVPSDIQAYYIGAEIKQHSNLDWGKVRNSLETSLSADNIVTTHLDQQLTSMLIYSAKDYQLKIFLMEYLSQNGELDDDNKMLLARYYRESGAFPTEAAWLETLSSQPSLRAIAMYQLDSLKSFFSVQKNFDGVDAQSRRMKRSTELFAIGVPFGSDVDENGAIVKLVNPKRTIPLAPRSEIPKQFLDHVEKVKQGTPLHETP